MSDNVKTKTRKLLNSLKCQLEFLIPKKEFQLIVKPQYMDIEPGPPSCPFDYIQVYDGMNMTEADATKMCGIDLPGPVYSETNYIKVFVALQADLYSHEILG